MDIQDLILQFRKEVEDQEAPYLWDDELVLTYLIDAQDMFWRKVGGISDAGYNPATQPITDLVLDANNPISPHSPFILHIRSGRLLNARKDVTFITEADLNDYSIRRYDYGNYSPIKLDDTATGAVDYGVIGLHDNAIRWYLVPVTADKCRCHVYRLPYPRITDESSKLEIDEHHKIHLLKWMKHMAYSKEDAETYDKELAEKNRQLFDEYCGDARLELNRRRGKAARIVKSSWW